MDTSALTGNSGRRLLDLQAFADANGLALDPFPPSVVPGTLFSLRPRRITIAPVGPNGEFRRTLGLRFAWPEFVEIANVTKPGAGSKRGEPGRKTWGTVHINTGRPSPQLVFDPNAGSVVPTPFEPAQLRATPPEWGGRLFVADGGDAYAGELLTDAVRAVLVQPNLPLSLEVVDGWIVLYSARFLADNDPALWPWLVHVIDTVVEAARRIAPETIAALTPVSARLARTRGR